MQVHVINNTNFTSLERLPQKRTYFALYSYHKNMGNDNLANQYYTKYSQALARTYYQKFQKSKQELLDLYDNDFRLKNGFFDQLKLNFKAWKIIGKIIRNKFLSIFFYPD